VRIFARPGLCIQESYMQCALCSGDPGKWNAMIVVVLTKTPHMRICRTSTRGHVSAANGVVIIFITCVSVAVLVLNSLGGDNLTYRHFQCSLLLGLEVLIYVFDQNLARRTAIILYLSYNQHNIVRPKKQSEHYNTYTYNIIVNRVYNFYF